MPSTNFPDALVRSSVPYMTSPTPARKKSPINTPNRMPLGNL